jgi:hypothetical protein
VDDILAQRLLHMFHDWLYGHVPPKVSGHAVKGFGGNIAGHVPKPG